MAYERKSEILVAIKRETTTGTAATAVGATQMLILDSPGLELKRAQIQSQTKRPDGNNQPSRLGYKTVDGSYSCELRVGGEHWMLAESIMRTTYATLTSITFASLTTVAIGTNTLTPGAGSSFITQGFRTGDIFTLSGTTVSGNNGLNTQIVAVTTGTMTVPNGTFTTLVATATGTMVILRKATQATTPTRLSHTVEQYRASSDLSELFLGCRLVGVAYSFKPGSPVTAQYTFMGMDRTALTTGTSPWFTSPTLSTSLALVADDSAIRYNGAAVATFTGFDLNFQITAAGVPVIGSLVTPDIFDDSMAVSASVTGLRQDFSDLTLFDAETEFDLCIKLEEPSTTSPKPCMAFYLPRLKIASISAPAGGGDGAEVVTTSFFVGPKTAATGFDAGVATISSSATYP